MELTGKCKEEFEKWYFKTQCSSNMKFEELLPHHINDVFGWLYNSSKIIQNAFIIEWFDWTGIIIQINNVCGGWWYRIKSESTSIQSQWFQECKSRSEATIQAIKKVNSIYNEKTE